MGPDKLGNSAWCCFNKFDCRLFISKFSPIAFYLYLSLSVISKNIAQPFCKSCSLSPRTVLIVRFTTNGMCMMNNTHVAQISRNKMRTTQDLYCCLVPQCEALRTCCSAFPITTKWCFDHDVNMVPGCGVATHWILWINPGAARCWRAAKCDNVLNEQRQSH